MFEICNFCNTKLSCGVRFNKQIILLECCCDILLWKLIIPGIEKTKYLPIVLFKMICFFSMKFWSMFHCSYEFLTLLKKNQFILVRPMYRLNNSISHNQILRNAGATRQNDWVNNWNDFLLVLHKPVLWSIWKTVLFKFKFNSFSIRASILSTVCRFWEGITLYVSAPMENLRVCKYTLN